MAFKLLAGEIFKPIKFSFKSALLRNQYAVSNKGRLVSFRVEIGDGKILNGTLIQGYKTFKAKPNGENITLFVHKIVAENFVKKTSKKAEFVIHLDHNKTNNKAENLLWVTRTELSEHLKQSPKLKAYYNRGEAKATKIAKQEAKAKLAKEQKDKPAKVKKSDPKDKAKSKDKAKVKSKDKPKGKEKSKNKKKK